jgi:seryl-tRNA synthetase
VLDDYLSPRERQVRCEHEELHQRIETLSSSLGRLEQERSIAESEVIRWRAEALDRWSEALAGETASHTEQLEQHIAALQNTLSWRITKPLRAARRYAANRGGTAYDGR